MTTAQIIGYDKELNEINNQLLDIAHKLNAHFDMDESSFAIMKIKQATFDIHKIRVKLINSIKDGIQQD
ncbi:MAG: hypothetical protein A3K54_00085 [Omnitrophica WOR_2 bacterium RBG_13_44_8]|nr:MAG: hypothetical protein A3K54_00085 [Omnitrophica WOR_2 bacterium RBG_13_44_8]